jgi:hypothetical protein
VTLVIAAAAGLAVLIFGLHHLALWAERRGWLYYRNSRRPRGVGLGLLSPIYNPGMEHVVEEETSARARRDETDHESAGAA